MAAVRAGAGAVHLYPRDASGAGTLDRHGLAAPGLHHGYGAATWPVLQAAIALGRDIRVGLEDTTILADGRLASGNAELVAAAASLAAVTSPPPDPLS